MAYNDLREWIAALDRAGELKRVKAEVDPILEITEITDRVSKWGARNGKGPGGPALLFENVKGYPGAQGTHQPVWQRTANEHGAWARIRSTRSRRGYGSSWT